MQNVNRRLQEALENRSTYCYENGVLINNLDIKDQKELDETEASITYLALNKLMLENQDFKFDVIYYLNIHKAIFSSIYPFAGDIRMENITKDNTTFCRPEYIVNYLSYLLEEMEKKSRRITSIDEYITFLAHYYSELNLVHPFREGNGRTLREFLRQMVEYLNKYLNFEPLELDYSKVDGILRKKIIDGSRIAATTDDITLLKEFFTGVLSYKEKINIR